jgi:hypothetical protein
MCYIDNLSNLFDGKSWHHLKRAFKSYDIKLSDKFGTESNFFVLELCARRTRVLVIKSECEGKKS